MGRHELEQATPEATSAKTALNDAKEAAYDAKAAVREAQRTEEQQQQALADAPPLHHEEPTSLKIAHAAERVWDRMMDATVNAWEAIKPKPDQVQDPDAPLEMRAVPPAEAAEKIDEKRYAKDALDVAKDTAAGLKQAIITEPMAAAQHKQPHMRKRHIKPDNVVAPVLDNVAKKGAELVDEGRVNSKAGWESAKQQAEEFGERIDPSLKQRRNRRGRKSKRSYAQVAADAPAAVPVNESA